uniref:Uncharacterized protein n=3 Tax=Anopheles stephensi TaxID=30069 RepID=A0A182YIG2_ANOST
MIYLVVAGVILFAYLFLYDWWTSYDFGVPSAKTTTIVRHGAVRTSTEVLAATAGAKERACDNTADGCDTEPPIGVTTLTNGNSTAEDQQATVGEAVDQLTSQLKQVSFSNANFLYDRPQPRRPQSKQKRLNRPQDKPCFVNGQQEQRPANAPVDTNDNHIKMDAAGEPAGPVVPTSDENSSLGQERASFIVGEEDSQLDDELEANDAFPQTMENGSGLRSSSSYEMNLTEKRRRLR